MRVLVVAGLGFELGLLRRAVPAGVALAVAGPGRARAEAALPQALARLRPEAVVGVGFCGALGPEARAGSLAVPARVGDGRRVLPVSLGLPGLDRDGLLVSAAQVVATPQAKAALRAASGARWVDMESYWWCRLAQGEGVPIAVLRVVLDEAGEGLPTLRHPASLAGLPRLVATALRQRRRLTAVVVRAVGTLAG